MSPASRVRLVAGVAAVAAAGTVVGVVYATRQNPPQPTANCKAASPLVVPGVRSQHVAAVRAAMKLPAKRAAQRLEAVARAAPKDALVQFNDATVLFCAGYVAEAEQAWQRAKKAGYDTYYEMRADTILHPQYFQPQDGLYPVFEPAHADPQLARGVLAQRLGHQHTAERIYARVARLQPDDDEAQVAAAVARFDEDNLSASFSRLGPLTKRFPRSQSVRFHLGLLLAWTGQRALAEKEFRRARSLGPETPLGREANAFLHGLVTGGTKATQR